MNTRHQIASAAAAVTLCCLVVGCSPTGWSVKQLPDGSGLNQGTPVTVKEKNGATYTGIYEGTTSAPSPEYLDRYAATSDPTVLPMIGEHITMTTTVTGEKLWDGDFLGFDDRHLWVMKDGTPTDLYFSSLSHVSDSRGHILQRLNLRGMFVAGEIPLMTTLLIRTGEKTYRVPLNDVEAVSIISGMVTASVPISGAQLRASLSSW